VDALRLPNKGRIAHKLIKDTILSDDNATMFTCPKCDIKDKNDASMNASYGTDPFEVAKLLCKCDKTTCPQIPGCPQQQNCLGVNLCGLTQLWASICRAAVR